MIDPRLVPFDREFYGYPPNPDDCPDLWHVSLDSTSDECPTCGDTDPLDDND